MTHTTEQLQTMSEFEVNKALCTHMLPRLMSEQPEQKRLAAMKISD